jgi:uncharacterized protein (DUF305 family)
MRKLVVLLGVIALVGCGGDDGGGEPTPEEQTSASAAVPFDLAFIDAMVPHHRQAIEMAQAAQARGLNEPDLQKIASDVVASQQQEIDRMLGWREEWFGSRKLGPVLPEVLGVPESQLGMEHGAADDVRAAEDVDATFAEMMIAHHEGAITMAEVAKERAEHDELKDLADAIVEAQEREVEIMEEHASGGH